MIGCHSLNGVKLKLLRLVVVLRLLLAVLADSQSSSPCSSPLFTHRRCSCSSNGSNDSLIVLLRCLPSFIIAGTQKSGTTVLAAYLSSHPSLVLSRRKEVHFFDRTRTYIKGLDSYLSAFPYVNYSVELDLSPPLFGEATPFYLASLNACRRISQDLPDVKMIVLLREPISRAYSEYQMQQRFFRGYYGIPPTNTIP